MALALFIFGAFAWFVFGIGVFQSKKLHELIVCVSCSLLGVWLMIIAALL